MRKVAATLLFLLTLFVEGQGQINISPEISCISVSDDGQIITLNWQAPADPTGSFISYHIFQSPVSTGSFTEVAEIFILSTNTFTFDAGAPVLSDYCFYIQTEYLSGGTPTMANASSTMCSIFINVTPSAAPQGFALINWNTPYTTAAPFVAGTFSVQMEYPAGTWTEIGQTDITQTSFSHEVSVCDEFLNFRIVLNTPFGCSFFSNIDGEQLTDLTYPTIPLVTSVSVDPTTNDAIIEWEPSTSNDCQGYLLYSCTGPNVTFIDTVWGLNTTTFTDLLAPTFNGPVGYLVAAFDTCYSGTPPSPNTSPAGDVCNESIFVSPIGYAICEDYVNINWTAYQGWADGVQEYRIWHSFDSGPWVLVGTVDGTTLTYQHTVTVGGTNSYYIEGVAVSGGYTAISNRQNVNVIYPASPAYNYISSATVIGPKKIELTILTEAVGSDHFYTIERQQAGTSDWDELITLNNLGTSILTHIDSFNVSTAIYAYEYRVIVENICGDIVDTSDVAISCLLNGFAYNNTLVNALQWTDYVGYDNGVAEYRIHRKMGLDGTDEVIATLGGTINYYEDDVSQLQASPGDFFYFIEAVSNPSSVYPDIYYANSNIIQLSLEPIIWIPNAFVIDGYNNVFQPVISFADFTNYRMIIYSRWGDVIYDTTDYNAPWDGFMNDRPVQQGVYVYFISVEDGRGRPIESRGTVTLLSERDQ